MDTTPVETPPVLLSDDELDRLERFAESSEAESPHVRIDAQEAEQEAALGALQTSLREEFFQANPEASDAEYQRVAPGLLDDELRRYAEPGGTARE